MQAVKDLIQNTVSFVKKELETAEAGHDWWHILRVWNNAKNIAKHETCNSLVVELSALLHDIADPKFHNGDEEIGPQKATTFLMDQGVSKDILQSVIYIIRHISFKNSFQQEDFTITPELAIVMDADRLDALGAIGIARTFHYGGYKNREIYNPNIPPVAYENKEAYKNSTAPTLNHFYEKLLKLKDGMHTNTGKQLAEERHTFMEQYLEHFYREWNGEE